MDAHNGYKLSAFAITSHQYLYRHVKAPSHETYSYQETKSPSRCTYLCILLHLLNYQEECIITTKNHIDIKQRTTYEIVDVVEKK